MRAWNGLQLCSGLTGECHHGLTSLLFSSRLLRVGRVSRERARNVTGGDELCYCSLDIRLYLVVMPCICMDVRRSTVHSKHWLDVADAGREGEDDAYCKRGAIDTNKQQRQSEKVTEKEDAGCGEEVIPA